jgi:hypothetical protein
VNKTLLNTAWTKRAKLRAEGAKLHAEGAKLRAEGAKLCAEGAKLCAEGDIHFLSAVIEECGPKATVEWGEDGGCTIAGVMLFLPKGETE